MRGQTKIAVAIGVILVVAGIWYAGSSDKPAGSNVTATNTPATDKPQDAQPVTVAVADRGMSSAPRPIAEPVVNSSGVASPAPRRIEEATGALPAGSDSARPQPAETHAPVPAMLPTELPGERAGLSTVLPNVGTSALERAAAEPAGDDVPHNADKEVKAAAPVLPPVTPVDIARTDTSTTKPAAASPSLTHAPVAEKPAAPAARATTPPPLPPIVTEKAADKPAAVADKAKTREHVVQAGETYTSIAVKYFGHAKYTKDLMKANPGKDARKLYVGAKLVIPEPPAGATPPAAKPTPAAPATAKLPVKGETAAAKSPDTKAVTAPKLPTKVAGKENQKVASVVPPADPNRSYTVQPGEGWYDLARKFMGDGKNYPELYEYNKERVGGDPHLLRAGTVIELPPKAKLPTKTSSPSTRPAK